MITVKMTRSSAEQENDDGSEAKRHLRFMIVDDTTATRKLMRRVLTSAGHIVLDEADNGYQ